MASLRRLAEGAISRRIETDNGIGNTGSIFTETYAVQLGVTSMLAMALYNATEMVVLVFLTFRRRHGLYFWSMLIASVGCGWFALGFVVNDFKLAGEHHIVPALMTVTGWTPMVTGQSLVLYSRLHLMTYNARKLRLVRNMIIFNAITQHIPIAVLVIGSNSNAPGQFLVPYSVYEKIEVSVFFVQEMILSGMYLNKSFSFLRHTQRAGNSLGSTDSQTRARGMVLHLILVNMLVVALDITILYLEFAGLYLIQTSYKAFVYSVKLKCEASILNKLVDFMKTIRAEHHQLPTITIGGASADAAAQAAAGKVSDWTSQLTRTMGETWGSSVARCEHGVRVGEGSTARASVGVLGGSTEDPTKPDMAPAEDPTSFITITQTIKFQHSGRENSAPASVAGEPSRSAVPGPPDRLHAESTTGQEMREMPRDGTPRFKPSVIRDSSSSHPEGDGG